MEAALLNSVAELAKHSNEQEARLITMENDYAQLLEKLALQLESSNLRLRRLESALLVSSNAETAAAA